MKKLLLLLLCTVSIYGQQEQDFDYGIKNTASQLDDNAPFLTVQDSTGVLKKSAASVWAKKLYVTNLPKPTLQQVTTAGNTTTNPIVVTTADFAGIAIQGTSNDNIGVLGTSNTGIGGAFSTVSGTKIASFSLAATEKAFIASDGTITASEGVLPNNVIVKSQLDAKVTGTGTINYLPKFTATGTVNNSQIFDNGTNVGIGTATPLAKFQIQSGLLGLIIGADNNALTLTDMVQKTARIGVTHYLNAEEPMAVFINTSDATSNFLTFGGGTASLNTATDIEFYTAGNSTTVTGTRRMKISRSGNLLINTTTDNGVDRIQVPNGTISALPATLSNQVVVKSQLDAKVSGTGTINYLPKFTATGTVENSQIFDNGTNVGIGTVSPIYKLDVNGSINATSLNSVSAVVSTRASKADLYGFTGPTLSYYNGTAIVPALTVGSTGNVRIEKLLINTTTDNGVDRIQVPNGTISALPATLSNQVVVKSQLDLKADLASPALTGTPTAPTATVGTNTTQLATTAFVLNNINSNTVLLTGNQSIMGTKTFNNFGGDNIVATNGNTSGSSSAIFAQTSNSGTAIIANGTPGSSGALFLGRSNNVTTSSISKDGVITGTSFVSNGTIRLKNYTVATLPTGFQGDTAYVTDATAPTYLGTLTGGGAVVCPVFFNGTIWVSH